jgi:HPt (histidine-containing phosphotransfer) domain-containing protein
VMTAFAENSINDIEELHTAIDKHKTETVLLLLHRIAGRTAQTGSKELAEQFRLAEMELTRDKELTADRIKIIVSLTHRLHKLIITANQYRLKDIVQ